MLNILRQRMRSYLSSNSVGMLSISGGEGVWAMPVHYRAEDLQVDCLVPRWADIAFSLQRCTDVLLVILSLSPSPPKERLCWLQYRGKAHTVANPEWRELLPRQTSEALAADLYLVVRVVPERIDLIDESHGWGARETLEIEDTYQ